ncbi:MAG TPA: FAD-dependent oxidoreductase, partial [Actinomycetota bacterium]
MADLVVVGGGPAGVAAALAGRRAGAEVVLIERGLLGGTCVHAGCISSAAYQPTASVLHDLRRAGALGIELEGGAASAKLSWDRVQAWASRASEAVAAGVRAQLSYAGVTVERRAA